MPKPTPKNHKKRYTWIIATAVTIPLILGVLFMAFAFQIPQYSYYYVKCGFKEPVKVIKDIDSSAPGLYTTPDNPDYAQTGLFVNQYYCTEADAQRNGNVSR